jgi:hypothetical protein
MLRKVIMEGMLQAYERPENPELVVKTMEKSVEECVQQIVALLEHNKILPKMRPMVSRGNEKFVSEKQGCGSGSG